MDEASVGEVLILPFPKSSFGDVPNRGDRSLCERIEVEDASNLLELDRGDGGGGTVMSSTRQCPDLILCT